MNACRIPLGNLILSMTATTLDWYWILKNHIPYQWANKIWTLNIIFIQTLQIVSNMCALFRCQYFSNTYLLWYFKLSFNESQTYIILSILKTNKVNNCWRPQLCNNLKSHLFTLSSNLNRHTGGLVGQELSENCT